MPTTSGRSSWATGGTEAKYTTNKSILPSSLTDEMREAFRRCEEFLDLERTGLDRDEKQKEEVRKGIEELTPEQLAEVRELVTEMSGRNAEAGEKGTWLPPPTTRRAS